jgi:hypothetical protein
LGPAVPEAPPGAENETPLALSESKRPGAVNAGRRQQCRRGVDLPRMMLLPVAVYVNPLKYMM